MRKLTKEEFVTRALADQELRRQKKNKRMYQEYNGYVSHNTDKRLKKYKWPRTSVRCK